MWDTDARNLEAHVGVDVDAYARSSWCCASLRSFGQLWSGLTAYRESYDAGLKDVSSALCRCCVLQVEKVYGRISPQ